MTDSERLRRHENDLYLAYWSQWLLRAEDLSHTILERRHGKYVALETLEQAEESEQQQRDIDYLKD